MHNGMGLVDLPRRIIERFVPEIIILKKVEDILCHFNFQTRRRLLANG